MKLLVVFDNAPKVQQNLRAALKTAQLIQKEKPELRNFLQVRVCVLALLPEDKPLDRYLGEMEQAGQSTLSIARQIIAEEKVENVTLELLRGMEFEGAEIIARRAKEWQADQIYLSLGQECFACKKARLVTARRGDTGLFKFFGIGRKIIPTIVASGDCAVSQSSVEVGDLLNLTNSRVVLTCHGEINLAVQKHQPHAGTKCERLVYERA